MTFLRFILLAIIILVVPMKSTGQNSLTLDDLIPGGKTYNKYRVNIPPVLGWMGDEFIYLKKDTLWAFASSEKNKVAKEYLSLDKVNKALIRAGYSEGVKSLRPAIADASAQTLFLYNDKMYLYSVGLDSILGTFDFVKGMGNQDYSENQKTLAYTKDNNLYLQELSGKEIAVTNEVDKGIVCGQSVHRNEFGIKKGIFWSPKGNLLAFYRMDETMVADYPLVDVSMRIAKLKDIKYPMAGMKSHHVTIGVYNPSTRQTIFLKTGTPKEKYLTNVAWSPDEKSIYVAELNRGQDTCVVKRYNALTGKLDAELFTETHPKYVEPESPVIFLKNDPDKFLWLSERDGYNHIYLYNTDGGLIKQLTSGNWDVVDVVGFDEKGQNLLILSTEESVIEQHVYAVNLKNGKRTRLTKEEGMHRPYLSTSGKLLGDIYTSQFNPGKIAITGINNNKTYISHKSKDPYKGIQMPTVTLGAVKANDGVTDLHYRIVKPSNFDETKKYPVIVYVYGGPHLQMINNSWMAGVRGWDLYMAEKGCIVFSLDNRGTPYRGLEFENATHQYLGVKETEDQMAGVNYLKSLPYVDSDRIGVHGWSFGGFMTLNLMLRHPETFKVGVAGGPVTDWNLYEIMYGERYMGAPKKNRDGYKETNMIERAGDLQGRLLMIHGDEDPTVVMQHTLLFMKKAVEKGSHPDLFIYPGHGHNVSGKDRVHLHEHITRYFDDFLK